MSIDPNRYVAVTANGAPADPQAQADLEAAARAGALAGSISGAEAGGAAGAERASQILDTKAEVNASNVGPYAAAWRAAIGVSPSGDKLNRNGDNAEAGLFEAIGEQTPTLETASLPIGDASLFFVFPPSGPISTVSWANLLEALVAQLGVLVDSEGNPFNPDSYDQTLAYDGLGNIQTITATDGVKTWVQTFTYDGSNVATISNWVVQ